jgi:two-component system cell cycle sensor histidine kinase/response regulator CckA
MDPHTFETQIAVARQRLTAVAQQGRGSAEQRAIWGTILEELARTLEELHVAAEELYQQNEELVGTRQAVEADRHRYRELFEEAPESYLVTDSEGTIREANHQAALLFGLCQEFLVGKPLVVFVAPDDRFTFHAHLTRMQAARMATAGTQTLQLRLQPRGGIPFPAAMIVGDVQDAGGHVIGLRWLVRESSEHPPVAVQGRQGEKLEALGTLAAGIVHDFNNFLAGMIGHAERATDGLPRGSTTWQALQDVLAMGGRAKDLIRKVLLFPHQKDAGGNPVALHLIVREAVRLVQSSLPPAIKLRQEIDPASGLVQVDPTQIHQVLMNLCTNAAHAMRARGGTLVVRVEDTKVAEAFAMAHLPLTPGPHVRLTVRDTGQGMTPQVQARIFDPFFTTKAAGEGTGMGLAVVHGIIASHRGAITVKSVPGRGTTVAIYLPWWDRVEAEGRPRGKPARLGEGRAQPPGG